jgi:hypothetical protein
VANPWVDVGLASSGIGKALFAGIAARTAPLGKLKHAVSIEAKGSLPEEIWQETGWLRGFDGKWRWEIPDNMLNVSPGKGAA